MNPDIYDWVAIHIELTEREASSSPYEDRAYYTHTVRGVASDMVQKGQLIRIQDGLFRIP